ncbi:hypothetical protein EDC96DRAFT_547511 [Choanephora cucurbitarum]|nr:hypothetical protein EDC96DRAFT_547511 [Choanephora cucurbitarum]
MSIMSLRSIWIKLVSSAQNTLSRIPIKKKNLSPVLVCQFLKVRLFALANKKKVAPERGDYQKDSKINGKLVFDLLNFSTTYDDDDDDDKEEKDKEDKEEEDDKDDKEEEDDKDDKEEDDDKDNDLDKRALEGAKGKESEAEKESGEGNESDEA